MNKSNVDAPKRSKIRSGISLIISLLFLLAAVWAVLNRQYIVDQITVWQFQPSAEIMNLANQSGLNDNGTFVYLASKPELNDRNSFNGNCTQRESQMIVLGCYSGGQIYIFDVTDTRIEGVKTVVAAHEMLHAAYERLDANERRLVDAMLESQLNSTTDQNILDLVEAYRKTEPGQELNELHSIFATEVSDLSPQLETYYQKYFTDRSKVVSKYTEYADVFNQLKTQATALQTELAALKGEIDDLTEQYKTESSTLDDKIEAFNKKAKTVGGFSSTNEFQTARETLLDRQTNLNNLVAKINQKIEDYNNGVEKLNALGIEINKLNQNLDSREAIAE